MEARQQLPECWSKVHELTKSGVDVYKVTIAVKERGYVNNGKRKKVARYVERDLYAFARNDKFSINKLVQQDELVNCLTALGIRRRVPRKSQLCLPSSGCDEGMPAEETSETKATLSSVRSAEKEMMQHIQRVNNCDDIGSFASHLKRRSIVTAGQSKTEVKNADSAVRKMSGRKQTGDVHDEGTADTESQGIKTLKAGTSNRLNVKRQPSTQTKSKVTESETGGESGVKKELKATEESDSRKKAKVTEESSARRKVKANKESRSEKKARVTVDESEVGKGMDKEEGKESSRPSSKKVRICMTCALQEPAPKVFKKCKRCKDEGCPDPPYYCGRDCQVLDWTARHREEHQNSCVGDPVMP